MTALCCARNADSLCISCMLPPTCVVPKHVLDNSHLGVAGPSSSNCPQPDKFVLPACSRAVAQGMCFCLLPHVGLSSLQGPPCHVALVLLGCVTSSSLQLYLPRCHAQLLHALPYGMPSARTLCPHHAVLLCALPRSRRALTCLPHMPRPNHAVPICQPYTL